MTDSTKPTLPEDLAEALDAYRAAIRDWRHCLIDMVTGDAETDTCGGAPAADDFGLSADDLLTFDLDERMAQRIDRALTRIEIKTTCMAAHAAEGRNAVYECVWDAIQEQFGDRDHRLDARDRCSRDRASQSDVTIPAPSTAEGSDVETSVASAATTKKAATAPAAETAPKTARSNWAPPTRASGVEFYLGAAGAA